MCRAEAFTVSEITTRTTPTDRRSLSQKLEVVTFKLGKFIAEEGLAGEINYVDIHITTGVKY